MYDFSEQIPLILKTFVGGGENFVMKEKLTFDWVKRELDVEITNETSRPQIEYMERTSFTVHPDNELHTLMRQTGHYKVDVMFGMHQMGVSMVEDMYQLRFTRTRSALSERNCLGSPYACVYVFMRFGCSFLLAVYL